MAFAISLHVASCIFLFRFVNDCSLVLNCFTSFLTLKKEMTSTATAAAATSPAQHTTQPLNFGPGW